MRHLNPVYLLFAAALFMAACQAGGPSRPWTYRQPEPAQAAPSPITGQQAQAQTQKRNDVQTAGAETPPPAVPEVERQKLNEPARPAPYQNPYAQSPAPGPDQRQQRQKRPRLTGTRPAETGPKARVGLLLPLSGEHEALGNAMLKAAQMALFDIGGGTLELLPRDTEGTPQGARQAAQSALDDGAQIVLGPVFAAAARTAKTITRRDNVNMIAFTTDWSLSGGNTFIMGFLPFDQLERILDYAAAQNLRRIGVLAPDSDYGRAVISAYRNIAPAKGITTVDTVIFSTAASNAAPVVRGFARYDERRQTIKMMKENTASPGAAEGRAGTEPALPPPFDAVLLPAGGDTARSLANLLSQFDLPPSTVRRLGTGLWDDPALAADPSLEGGWFAAPSPRGRESFENRFNALYKARPPRLASLAYDATALAAVLARTGLRQTGRPDFSRRAIGNPNGFAGIDGIFRFRPDGNVERGLAVLEFDDGEIRIIDSAPQTFQRPGSAY